MHVTKVNWQLLCCCRVPTNRIVTSNVSIDSLYVVTKVCHNQKYKIMHVTKVNWQLLCGVPSNRSIARNTPRMIAYLHAKFHPARFIIAKVVRSHTHKRGCFIYSIDLFCTYTYIYYPFYTALSSTRPAVHVWCQLSKSCWSDVHSITP
jgi:hypothetical protein